MALLLVPLLIAVAVFIFVMGFRISFVQGRKVEARLQEIQSEFMEAPALPPSLTQRSLPPFWRMVAMVGWLLPGMMQSEDLAWSMAQAGIRRREAPGLFVGAKVILAVGLGLFVFLGLATAPVTLNARIVSILAAVALGFYLPNIWLAYRTSQRRQELTLALPDALDLMVVCVEAGQGLNAALATVGRELRRGESILGEEMLLINHEIQAGLTRSQ
jgi:tight adherence protein C